MKSSLQHNINIFQVKKSTGKFSFRDILAKMENKKECYQYLSSKNFQKMKIVLAKWTGDR